MTATAPVTIEDIERWFEVSWSDIMDHAAYALEDGGKSLADFHRIVAYAERMVSGIAGRMYKSRAQCPEQLRQWFYRQIDRHVEKLCRQNKVLRADAKSFEYEQHGEKAFIRLTDAKGNRHLWVIPASWLEWARQLWPVYVRRYPNGKYFVARKVSILRPDGTTTQKETAIHRLFAGIGAVRHGYDDCAEVRAKDGNLLNFCDGNLERIKGSDLLDHCSYSDNLEEIATTDGMYFKPVNTSSEEGINRPWNWHERSVLKLLGGKYDNESDTASCEVEMEDSKNILQ